MIKYIGNNILDYEGIENTTMQECIEYCKSKKILGLDIETGRLYPKNRYREDVYKPGLDPHMTRIVMIQIGDLDCRFVIDARVVDYSGLKEILDNNDILKVGVNLKFEGKFFLKYLGCRIQNVWDCMIVEKLLYNGLRKSNSLSAMMYRYLGIQPVQNINLFTGIDKEIKKRSKHRYNEYILSGISKDEDEIEAEIEQELLENEYIDKSIRMGFIDIGDAPFTLKQVKYGDEDITAPLKIYKKQLEGVDGWFPKTAIDLENKFTQVLAEIELKGMYFDQQKWLDIYNDALVLYNKRLDKLNQFIEDNYPQYCGSGDLFSNRPVCAIKWTSSKQVISFLSPLDWCSKEKSKTTGKFSYTVGAKSMFRLLNNDNKGRFFKQKDYDSITDKQSFILQYLLFKKSEQAVTTFGKDWLKYVHPVTKRVHSSYRQLMNTTRPSSTNPNLLNIPAGNYRYAFSSPNGWKIVNCDYAGQELRSAAHIHNVSKMIQFFNEGDPKFGSDFHSYSATQMQRAMKNDPNYIVEPKELSDGSKNPNFTNDHSKERNDSKAITFLLNYGGSSYSLSQDLGISEEEAEKYVANYFSGLPGMQESFESKKKEAAELGYIVLSEVTGARYFYPYHNDMTKLKEKAYSYYPDNYNELSVEGKNKVKASIKHITGPLWRQFFYYLSKLERRALNYPVQGSSAQMMKLACIYLYNYRWSNNLQNDIFITNVIYDEINSEAKEAYAKEWAEKVEKAMIKAGSTICSKVKFEADAIVSDHWQH